MPLKFIQRFIQHEAFTGGLLMLTALIALVISNSSYQHAYHHFFQSTHLLGFALTKPLEYWINHGLMSFFFVQVGLEIKREIMEGELNSVKKALLPGIAALGGMIVPAAVFILINIKYPAYWSAWSVPVATDIAFSLAVLQLFGKRVPLALKLFLLALATFDDLGAIVIIAVFYTRVIHWKMLGLAFLAWFILGIFNFFRVRFLSAYFLFGIFLWIFVAQSGIDAAIAGVFFAMAIPLKLEKPALQ